MNLSLILFVLCTNHNSQLITKVRMKKVVKKSVSLNYLILSWGVHKINDGWQGCLHCSSLQEWSRTWGGTCRSISDWACQEGRSFHYHQGQFNFKMFFFSFKMFFITRSISDWACQEGRSFHYHQGQFNFKMFFFSFKFWFYFSLLCLNIS